MQQFRSITLPFCCSHKPVLCHFSTQRQEVESASLSAKEECVGRLKEGDRRAGGVIADTSDTPPLRPPPLPPPIPPPPV